MQAFTFKQAVRSILDRSSYVLTWRSSVKRHFEIKNSISTKFITLPTHSISTTPKPHFSTGQVIVTDPLTHCNYYKNPHKNLLRCRTKKLKIYLKSEEIGEFSEHINVMFKSSSRYTDGIMSPYPVDSRLKVPQDSKYGAESNPQNPQKSVQTHEALPGQYAR